MKNLRVYLILIEPQECTVIIGGESFEASKKCIIQNRNCVVVMSQGQVSFVVIGNFDVTEACKLQEVQV